ncbi:hypothetical protein HHI36_021545 [Cryptolaemus montrouzieri]|uniref:Uncharacterized protein n=1 Tax=Cryptolaemus montrouzieri TaxID=559131 RepID=A0ABD2MXG1_9CUCU
MIAFLEIIVDLWKIWHLSKKQQLVVEEFGPLPRNNSGLRKNLTPFQETTVGCGRIWTPSKKQQWVMEEFGPFPRNNSGLRKNLAPFLEHFTE